MHRDRYRWGRLAASRDRSAANLRRECGVSRPLQPVTEQTSLAALPGVEIRAFVPRNRMFVECLRTSSFDGLPV